LCSSSNAIETPLLTHRIVRCDVLSKGFNRGTRTYYFNYSSAIADFIAISLFKAESRAAVIIHTRLHVAAV
jgi:hypothetical protein